MYMLARCYPDSSVVSIVKLISFDPKSTLVCQLIIRKANFKLQIKIISCRDSIKEFEIRICNVLFSAIDRIITIFL